jgi:hypothetical protein
MPALERACYFASWCLAGTYHSASHWWVDSAATIAARPTFGYRSVPRAQC